MKNTFISNMFKRLSVLTAAAIFFIGALSLPAQNVPAGKGVDTLFNDVSIQDLIKIKKYYDSKVEKIRKEKESYRTQGMEWSQSFLQEKGAQIKDRDRVYIRLAEYYIEESERRYEKAIDAYDTLYTAYEKELARFDNKEIDVEPRPPEFPKYDYSEAIALYDRILDEYPESDYADDALYSKAWLLEKMAKGDESRRVYREVINKYPDSRFAPESYMRLAEHYFSPRSDDLEKDPRVLELRKQLSATTDPQKISDLEGKIQEYKDEQRLVAVRKAIQLYNSVLKYKDSKRYDEALYKIGWGYYKLAAKNPKYYNDAITHFMLVADDITRAKKLDPKGEISNFNVRDEAVQYIGISFTDEAYTKNGVDKARRLIERIGGREYGPEIMESIGSTFQHIDEQNKAIYAYETLLDMYPNYKKAPQIQQNIATSLFALGKDADAYRAREKLYLTYNPEAEWYKKLSDSDIPDKLTYLKLAYKYSEAALRTNLLLDLEAAEEKTAANQPATEYYVRFADKCKDYLSYYPADTNAYDVNWSYALMLDSRLGRYEEAFEEYIRVSNDYLETQHQEDAAVNAVGVADTLVKLKYGKTDTIKFNFGDLAKLSPEELTPEETRLIEAYKNYIKLFPNGSFTPNFLAAAGGIYYNHKKFAESKMYFQTLVKRFPGAEEKSLAMRSIMDSYFALGKFKDSEVVAKRIMGESNISESQKEFARKRLGQAIFKNAEYLEEQGDYFTAASEYWRVYEEAPGEQKLVERALYNSGFNFQRAKDWIRAVSVLDTLATNFPKSQFAVKALQKMAEDYQELEQFSKAAATYERIYNDYPDSENRDVALYNAGFFYKKGQDWSNAIRVNNRYIQNYPKQSYSTDLFFSNAELYLKMNNIAEANKIYEAFAKKYPDDPRTVRAYYERGKYYLNNKQTALAQRELNAAIKRSEALRKKGKDYNPFIAAEAVNMLAEILHKEYLALELKQPASSIRAGLNKARSIMKKLIENYKKVLAFGSPRSFEATFNIARTYEEFAGKFAGQELPAGLSADKQFVEKQKINQQAAKLYDMAVEQYKNVVDNFPKIASRLNVDMEAPPAVQSAMQDTSKTPDELKRIAEADSTREMARKWYGKAKDKISELLYTEASLTSENIYQAINIKAPQSDPIQRLVYRKAVLLKVVAPAIKTTVQAHLRNISEANELGLSNKYVEESKRQILLTSNILATEFESMSYAALDHFAKLYNEVRDLIEQNFGAKNAQGLDYYALDDDANQLLDYSKIFSNAVITSFNNSLTLADENNIKNDLLLNTQNRLLRFSVEMADKMQVYADSSKKLSASYKARFAKNTDNFNYDDATGFYENYYFSLTDIAKDIMDQAYQIQQQYNIQNLWVNKLLYRLIKLDPATYSASIEKEKVEIFSDDSWKYSTVYLADQWTKRDFEDDYWDNAQIIPGTENQFSGLGVSPQAIWVLSAPQNPATNDSTMLNDSLTVDQPANADSTVLALSDSSMRQTTAEDTLVFFRKTFELSGKPMGGNVYLTADDDFRIYINGEYILDDEANDYAQLDTLDFYTIEIYLKKGRNVIAVDVADNDLTARGLKLYAEFELLPENITAAAEDRAKVKKVVVEPSILRKVNILNRNRISLKK